MVKLTFSLDEATVTRLRRAAGRLGRPQSWVIREAVKEYAARVGRLGEEERLRLLRVIDTQLSQVPVRPEAEVDVELAALRAERRQGGRRHRAE